jgi:hypothetical protein
MKASSAWRCSWAADTTPSSAVVQTAGHAYRLEARVLKQEFSRAGSLQALLLRYTQALMTQMAQIAACNRHHSVEQQLCRWLLMTLDRLPGNELVMTQELISGMLGVRREGITEAAGRLQRNGFILYRRGHITVLDRRGLEKHALRVLRRGQKGIDPPAVRCAASSEHLLAGRRTCVQPGACRAVSRSVARARLKVSPPARPPPASVNRLP